MLLGFLVCTHSALDMPMVMQGIYKYSLVTKKRCNRLGLHVGNKSHFGLFNYLKGYHLQYRLPITPIGHGGFVQIHHHILLWLLTHFLRFCLL